MDYKQEMAKAPTSITLGPQMNDLEIQMFPYSMDLMLTPRPLPGPFDRAALMVINRVPAHLLTKAQDQNKADAKPLPVIEADRDPWNANWLRRPKEPGKGDEEEEEEEEGQPEDEEEDQ